MNLIVGSLLVLLSVAVGFTLSGGKLLALFQPYELLVIAGSAFGAFFISNPMHVVIDTIKAVPALMGGSKYNRDRYMELLGLLNAILQKARKEGMLSIEGDVEEPQSSPLFERFPHVLKDHHALDFITDYLRMMISGNMNTFQLDNLMQVELDTHHHEGGETAHALTRVSDALPGFGIVAAVLGVVITMGSLGGEVQEIGHHVAAALVGTFLGILFAYGFVGPMATALEHRNEDAGKFLEVAKAILLASAQGYAPVVALEFGRKTMPSLVRPSFRELEEFLKQG
jgi:chemotaxis protein MotA